MSLAQSLHQAIHTGAVFKSKERSNKDIGSYDYLPHVARDQTSQGPSWLSDSAAPLFATYLKISEEQERRRAEQLKIDTDQLLVFCGLFSATVAPLVVTFIPDLSPYQISYDDGKTWTPYTPPSYLIWANSLWFLSLLISLTCGVAAMVLQQWTRRHLPYYNVHKEARMRAFFADGRATLDFPVIVASITVLVHIAVILFFAGVLIFMKNLNNTIFKIALAWIALCMLAYVGVTSLPVFRPETSFRTPFSNLILLIRAAILRCGREMIWLTTRGSSGPHRKDPPGGLSPWNLVSLAEERVMNQSSKIDGTVLKRTLETVRDDHDREQFFDAIPGFLASDMVENPRGSLDVMGRENLAEALVGFLDCTFSSNLLSESVKGRRLIICMKVIEAAGLTIAVPSILRVLFSRGVGGISQSPEVCHSLGNLRNSNVEPLARVILSGIISHAERDDSWRTLVMEQLGISEDVLQNYLKHGDSVLLANLIHTTGHLHSLADGNRELARESLSILPLISKFDILNTLPELQHDFCTLWDSIVQQAQKGKTENNPFIEIPLDIRRLHTALQQSNLTPTCFFTSTADTLHQASSYAVGEIADHQPNSTLSTSDVAGVPLRASSSAFPTTSYSSPLQSQNLPIIPPVGTSVMQGIAGTSSYSSIGIFKSIVPSSPGTDHANIQTERSRVA